MLNKSKFLADKKQRQRALKNQFQTATNMARRNIDYFCPEDYERRLRLEANTKDWLLYYLHDIFYLEFGEIHEDLINELDYKSEQGGFSSIAYPRGSGKTSIVLGASLKYILTGKLEYIIIVGATASDAENNIKKIKSMLLFNDRINLDYPEVCAVLRANKGAPQALKSATANWEPSNCEWKKDMIALPTLPLILPSGEKINPPSFFGIIETAGLTGSIRGRSHVRPDGKNVRPDLALVDDPQTTESASSLSQCQQREGLILKDIANLCGPSKEMSIFMPCTIIKKNDLADKFTNKEKMPDWNGKRLPFFVSMPENLELWEQFNEERLKGEEQRDKGANSRNFYLKNFKELNKGVKISWLNRGGDNFVDGVHWGMTQYFKLGKEAFYSELQNDPIDDISSLTLSIDDVLSKNSGLARWKIPDETLCTVAFVDCNPRTSGLWWVVASFTRQNSYIVSYGKTPLVVNKKDTTLQEQKKMFEQLNTLINGIVMKVDILDCIAIDAGYNYETVITFVKRYRGSVKIFASRGRASKRYNDQGRDIIRRMPCVHLRKNEKKERYLSHNADKLREVVQLSFLGEPNTPGVCLLNKPEARKNHQLFADSICSTKLKNKAITDNGIMYEWTTAPGEVNDHLLDCVVGSFALASFLGVDVLGSNAILVGEKENIATRRVGRKTKLIVR